MRVSIPPYTDRWMMGDRCGDVLKTTFRNVREACGLRAAILTSQRFQNRVEIAHVRLDKSGKTVRVVLDDCSVI